MLQKFNIIKKEALVVLHHDSITGTCTDEVLNEYKDRITSSMDKLKELINLIWNEFVNISDN